MKPKDLECLVQEEMSKPCESYKVIHSHDHQTLDTLGNMDSLDPSPSSVQLQRLKTDAEHCGLLNGSQDLHPKEPAHGETLKGVKQDDFPIIDPSEEHSKIKVDLPLEKPLGKSKSFDLGELQISKTQEPLKKGSSQTQTTEVLKIREDLPKKNQKKIDSQTISSQEKGHQDTPQLLQSHESASKSPSILQNSSTQTSVLPEMDPCSLQSQELREMIQPQSSKLQRTTNSKMLQGHHQAENCELGVEDSHPEMRGNLQRSPQSFLVQDILYPLADTFRKSKSLELPKGNIGLLQGLKRPDISRSQENVKECPQILDDQTSSWEMNMSSQEKKSRCPTQKELKDSQSQEELGQNKPTILNPEDDHTQKLQRQERMEVLPSPGVPQECVFLQIQGNLQSHPEYFGCEDLNHPDVLQPEKHSAIPETLEFEKHGESITQLSLVSTEKGALSVWWPLGKSKSLDFREHQVPSLKSLLGELDCSKTQKMPSANLSQPQRNLQDEQRKCRTPLVFSKTQPLEDLSSKDKIGQQEENHCANQKTEHMELEAEKSQELLTHEREIMAFQKLEDIQMFCSKEYRELEAPQLQVNSQSLKEPLCTDQGVQTESKSQGLRKPLNHQVERNLQSPPSLRNLLRKSKTFGYEEPTSRVDPHIQNVQREEEPAERHSLHVEKQLLQRFEGPKSQIIQEIIKPEVLQHREIANVESIGESRGQPNCPKEAHKIEMGSIKSKISLHANQEPPQQQEDTQHIVPQDSVPHVVPPCDIPQFGIKFLQELGRLHNELSTLRPSQEVKDGKAICPQSAKVSSQPQQQIPAEPQINTGSQVLQHQKWSTATSPQPPPSSPGDFSEPSKMQPPSLQSPQSQGPDQMPRVKRELARNMGSPMQKAPQMVQWQEDLSKKSIVVSGMTDPPFLQSLENVEAKILDLQEPLNLEGKVREKEPTVRELRKDHPSNMKELLMAKSKSLAPQSLSRTREFQHERTKTVKGLPSLDKEMATKRRPISQGPLNIQAEAISSQNQKFPTKQENQSILLPQNQKEAMTQQVGQHFQEKHKRLKLQEGRNLKSWKGQELESLQLQWMEENQAFQEWRKAGTLLAEGTQPRNRSTREKGLLNLGDLEPEDESRRLERLWEQKTTETTAMTLLSPSSPGKPSEMIWEPSSLNMDISRETSFDAAQPSSPSWEINVHIRVTCPGDSPSLEKSTDQPQPGEPNQKAISSFPGEGVDGQPLLPPRPPSREKAFLWLSPQDKKEALQRLAETQAEGERRHQRDKERQALRFQERLSIAKRRRSTQDLLGDGPGDRGPWASAISEGQDEAGQKMAVKTHLEKIKRERTNIMQSKRERNTLKFKELLDPLVVPREEKPTPRQAEELQQRGNLCPSGSPGDRVKLEALSHITRMIPKEE
ncbi:histone-lysine N-methyltransferase 2D-like [Pantherophis guttatus]|uniref:Histone-lysine N-methyltransferase 2D-like n=1 Tax=Pantherophis guttatus TaxID=94885 RepID=A0A6P9AW14_PANGU|nr:histone-lysine N-methyltransferase 2D-like [Pantherophis guttatus]